MAALALNFFFDMALVIKQHVLRQIEDLFPGYGRI
jgi:hypothetical protein